MPAKRPASFTVFGILCIVFGSLGLLCNVIGLAGQAVQTATAKTTPVKTGNPNNVDTAALEAYMRDKVPGYQAVALGSAALSLLMSGVLLASGIGLMKMQRWSRATCILYAGVTILEQLGAMVYQIAFVTPVIEEYLQQLNPPPPLPAWFFIAIFMIVALIGMTFAVILLIFAIRPAMGRQLAGADAVEDSALGRQEPQDFYDEDYQRQRHEPPPEL
jgi:hypothetical protein